MPCCIFFFHNMISKVYDSDRVLHVCQKSAIYLLSITEQYLDKPQWNLEYLFCSKNRNLLLHVFTELLYSTETVLWDPSYFHTLYILRSSPIKTKIVILRHVIQSASISLMRYILEECTSNLKCCSNLGGKHKLVDKWKAKYLGSCISLWYRKVFE